MTRIQEIKEDIEKVLGCSITSWTPFRRTFRRALKHIWQKIATGVSDSETYSLDHTIGRFAYKRLKIFRKIRGGHPSDLTEKQWSEILKEMEWFLSLHSDGMWNHARVDEKRYRKAGRLFGTYFGHLWW